MTVGRQQPTAVHRALVAARWAGALALCLAVAVYAWHVHGVMEHRVATLEAAVAEMQRQLAAHPAAIGVTGLRNKRDATSSGQCLCPPGKCIYYIIIP